MRTGIIVILMLGLALPAQGASFNDFYHDFYHTWAREVHSPLTEISTFLPSDTGPVHYFWTHANESFTLTLLNSTG